VARGGGIHHDKLSASLAYRTRKRLKDGNFFGTGRAQVLRQQCASGRIEFLAFCLHHLPAVTLGFRMRIDAAHAQMFH